MRAAANAAARFFAVVTMHPCPSLIFQRIIIRNENGTQQLVGKAIVHKLRPIPFKCRKIFKTNHHGRTVRIDDHLVFLRFPIDLCAVQKLQILD